MVPPWIQTINPRTVITTSGAITSTPSQLVVNPARRAPRTWSADMAQMMTAATRNDMNPPLNSRPPSVMPFRIAGKK